MSENEMAKQILDSAFVIHTKLGSGVFESVYEVVLAHELRKRGLTVERQKSMSILYDGIRFDEAFRSDLVVNGKVDRRIEVRRGPFGSSHGTSLNAASLDWPQARAAYQFWRRHLKNGIKRVINGQLDYAETPEITL